MKTIKSGVQSGKEGVMERTHVKLRQLAKGTLAEQVLDGQKV